MKVLIGADHGGFELKEKIKKHLCEKAIDVKDYGTHSADSCDYNDIALSVSEAIVKGEADRGILVCGTGVGMAIQANKVEGIRAALVHDMFTAKATREHNDSNVLTMGGRIIGDELANAIVDIWLETPFSKEDRHQRRVDKLNR